MSMAVVGSPRALLKLSPRARHISVYLAVLGALFTVVEPAWLGLTPDLSAIALRLWGATAIILAATALSRGSRDAAFVLAAAAFGGLMLALRLDLRASSNKRRLPCFMTSVLRQRTESQSMLRMTCSKLSLS